MFEGWRWSGRWCRRCAAPSEPTERRASRTLAWLSSALRSRLGAGSAVAAGGTITPWMQLPAGNLSAATSEARFASRVASVVEERSWGKDGLRLQELWRANPCVRGYA